MIDKIYSSVTKDNRIKRLENMILENTSQIKRISCKNINEDIKQVKPEENDRYDRICDEIQRLDNKLDEVNKINCEDYVKELDSKFKLMEFWLNKKLDETNSQHPPSACPRSQPGFLPSPQCRPFLVGLGRGLLMLPSWRLQPAPCLAHPMPSMAHCR